MRHLLKVVPWFTVGVSVILLVSGCNPPPPPSAETAALEPSLLTLADVDGGFEEESRGQVGVSGDKLCPDADFAFEDVGAVRVAFAWPTGNDEQVELVETLRVVGADEIAVLMADLEAALELCEGVEWVDYGETKSLTVMAVPEIGDNSLATRSPANQPSVGRYDYGRRIYVAQGDTFVEITIWETLEGATDTPVVSDDEMYRIAASATARLPN
jgi:hypothetical protein